MPMSKEKRDKVLGEEAEAETKGSWKEGRGRMAEENGRRAPEEREQEESDRRGGFEHGGRILRSRAMCNSTPESTKTNSDHSTGVYTAPANDQPNEWDYEGECKHDRLSGLGRPIRPIFVNKNGTGELYSCGLSKQDPWRNLIQRGIASHPDSPYHAHDILETNKKHVRNTFYESHSIVNKKTGIYGEKRFYGCGCSAQGKHSGHDIGMERYGSARFDGSLCDDGGVYLGDSAHIKSNKNPVNLYGTPNSHMTSQENENDSTTYKIVIDTVLRIQSVFEEVYTYLHGVLFHLSTDGGFEPYTEAMASQLEAFRMSASRAVYTPDDRLYYKDIELKYRCGFEGRKQSSYYKDKYHAFYEENKDVEAVKHLAKIDVPKRGKEGNK